MHLEIKIRPGSIEEVVQISPQIPELIDPYDATVYQTRLSGGHLILVATIDGRAVGFKVGYDRYRDGKSFYSWMGGVVPDYRNRQVAVRLLESMEDWCKKTGYCYLQFKTLNRHKSMIHFGVKNGFEITGFKENKVDSSKSKIYFKKEL